MHGTFVVRDPNFADEKSEILVTLSNSNRTNLDYIRRNWLLDRYPQRPLSYSETEDGHHNGRSCQ